MSTRANILINDEDDTLFFYRHFNGDPECTGADLAEFVQGYLDGSMRDNVLQSAGWLIVRGHVGLADGTPTLQPNSSDKFSGWKVGDYEPTTQLHGDVEYIYILDLTTKHLLCAVPTEKFWDEPSLKNTESLYNDNFVSALKQPKIKRGAK